ncbi:hypothetical protein [Vibrio hepatarius]|uniref:hypothetical protein n=1 Tax=Vibrio hepatarius TaxID=171383 RepID=UPI001C09C006|nr:hypothetical protein [Vibrio hepatarius]MBU2899383.1 hypothetical protein [Vibrio hepatarius]
MNVKSIRDTLNTSIGELTEIKNLIVSTRKYAEESIRVNEMSALLLAFSILSDEEIEQQVFEIDRIHEAVNNYSEFMKSCF